MPKLKAVFYAAGNVSSFAQPQIDNNVTLTSAWHGMAWYSVAWRGVAWRGVAWRGMTSQCHPSSRNALISNFIIITWLF
jgi:hypothetical protein